MAFHPAEVSLVQDLQLVYGQPRAYRGLTAKADATYKLRRAENFFRHFQQVCAP
jgi:hypothetical protein